MTVKIEGHDCMLFADCDRAVLTRLSFRGKIRWLEYRVRALRWARLSSIFRKSSSDLGHDLGDLLVPDLVVGRDAVDFGGLGEDGLGHG